MKRNTNKLVKIVIALLFTIIIRTDIYNGYQTGNSTQNTVNSIENYYAISDIPAYNGKIYVEINENTPKFTNEDMQIETHYYSELENERARNGNYKNQLEKGK